MEFLSNIFFIFSIVCGIFSAFFWHASASIEIGNHLILGNIEDECENEFDKYRRNHNFFEKFKLLYLHTKSIFTKKDEIVIMFPDDCLTRMKIISLLNSHAAMLAFFAVLFQVIHTAIEKFFVA